MRILITGAAGFVGHHTIEHFLKNTTDEIVCIDSFRHKGDSMRLRHLFPPQDMKAGLRIFTHDLTTPISSRMIDAVGEVDAILSIASESHVERSISEPVPFVKNNVALALEVLEYARKVKPKIVIQCGTDEVFGPAIGTDAHTEWLPFMPSNPYAASKAAQDAIFFSYWRTYGVPVVFTHCMNMIGERQDPEKFIPMCISRILKGETVTIHGKEGDIGSRMYIHCRNLADAWLFLLKKTEPTPYHDDHTRYQTPDSYNVVGEVELDNLTVARMISDILKMPLKYELQDFHEARPGHDRRYALDGSKISALGWKPPVAFKESLEKMVYWTLNHPEWLK